MIDLHCHILPGIDDGARDIVEAIAMAKIAAADGIRRIVASPHIDGAHVPGGNSENHHLSETLDAQVDFLNRCLEAEGVPLGVVRGSEISAFLPPEACFQFTINRTAYLLVEFPSSHLPVNARELVFSMIVSGLKPILAHPERNLSVIQDPERLRELAESGALIQITADSFLGEFGPECRACAHYLLKEKMVSFVASDAHGAAHRVPVLSRAFEAVKKGFGEAMATALFAENPAAVIDGTSLGRP